MDHLHWTEVDGVTTVWTDAPGPLRAGLFFRTGRVDETLITAGHTHLIEHMALSRLGDLTQTSNGFVTGNFTGFLTLGRPEDVCIFFRKLCAGLARLPAERLEAEKKILLAEAAGRRYNPNENLLIWRYGAAGHGLAGLPELGIQGAAIEQLEARRDQYFTRGNAVLWLTGPVPADLRLDLAPGEKQALPPLQPILSQFPSWFVDDHCGGIAVSTTVPRVAEGPIFHIILTRRMQEELRNKRAVSYSPAGSYDPLNADTAHLMLLADSEPDRRAELADAFGEIFEKFADTDEQEVQAACKLYVDHMTGPLAPPPAERLAYEAQRGAVDWIFGRPYEPFEQLTEEALALTADDLNAFGQRVRDSAILAVPAAAEIQPWMGKPAPISTGHRVTGREIPHVDAPIVTERLVVGSEGVSLINGQGSHMTVRYAELAAALHYDDGGLQLVSHESTWLRIEPTVWRNGARVCAEIRGKIPAGLLLDQGARAQDSIPKAQTTALQRLLARLR